MKTRSSFLLLASLLSAAVVSAETSVITPRQALALTAAELATNGVQRVRGVVTFVSGVDSNRFVLTSEGHSSWQGLVVRASDGLHPPRLGDIVLVQGAIGAEAGERLLSADAVDFVRAEELDPPAVAKQADFRRGLLTGRRVALIGTVREIRSEQTDRGVVSVVKLFLDNYTVIVRVAGSLDAEKLLRAPVRVTGLACCQLSGEGKLLDAWLEVAGADDLVNLEGESRAEVLYWTSIGLGIVLTFVSFFALRLWLRGRRERLEMAVVAAERRRMAADLHDTIEQHLAGANLIAAGVSQLDDTPADVREAMQTLTALLANAKAEVRSAVLNLRSAGETEKSLAARIGEMAQALAKTGVKTRKLLRGLPAELPEGVYQDIVLIVREATTNAVKHGKATEIIFTADPYGKDGWVLRVLNNGAPFEVDQALGPETGHYGLSGMQERALRNHLAISWGRDGKWTYVQLQSEERT